MALTDESSIVMPVAPAYNGGFGGSGFGGDWAWILLLLVLFGGGGFGGGFGMDGLYPWMNNSQNINDGFRDQMLNTSISGISSQIASNQIAELERSFAAQTAVTQGMTGIQSQLSQCCCDNRLATCQTQNLVASEGAATRAAIQAQTQAILDKMCQQEIDALKAQNVALQNQVNMQNLAASQTAQTAALIADNTAQTQYLVNRIAPYPVPAYTVTNPNTPAAEEGRPTMHERVFEKLERILDDMDAKEKLSSSDVQIIDWITHAQKSMLARDGMEGGYSAAGMPYHGSYRDDGSYGRGRKRDSMGRYSSDGYSRHGDMADQLRSMMAEAPDEKTRQELHRLASKMEQM